MGEGTGPVAISDGAILRVLPIRMGGRLPVLPAGRQLPMLASVLVRRSEIAAHFAGCDVDCRFTNR